MTKYIRDEIKPDMFFWTGDNSAHVVWDNSNEEVIGYTVNITNTLKEVFKASSVSFYPIQGNHDTWPVNVQSFDKEGNNIPLETYKKVWNGWLTPESIEQFQKYGYYSQNLVIDGKELNAKVIGINTQTCNNMNWFLL